MCGMIRGRGSFYSRVPPVIQELRAEKTSSMEIPGAFVKNKLAIPLTLENKGSNCMSPLTCGFVFSLITVTSTCTIHAS